MMAAHVAFVSAGAFFLVGLLTGVWKYQCIASSKEAAAPAYVDIAHRASLMYAFACMLLAEFAARSVWPTTVNTIAVIVLVAWFAIAVLGYVMHGILRDTDNQLRRPHRLGSRTIAPSTLHTLMVALIVGEVGGFLVLFVGAVAGL